MILPRESRNRDFYMPTLTLVNKLIFKIYVLCLLVLRAKQTISAGPGSSLFPGSIRNVLQASAEGFGRTL